MKLTIQSLTIKNFKGIKDLSLNLHEKKTNIYGNNAVGKTTIYDAYSWLFSGKDSDAKAQFDIKPLNDDNSVKHNLETSVECAFTLKDGKGQREHTAKKVYSEVWTRPRGQENEVLSHKTVHFLDGIELETKKEWDSAIKSISEHFDVLSYVRHFNEVLSWKKRRQILFSMISKVDSNEIIDKNPDLNLPKDKDIEYEGLIAEANKKALKMRLSELNGAVKDRKKDIANIDTAGLSEPEALKLLKKSIATATKKNVNPEANNNKLDIEILETQREINKLRAEQVSIKASNLYIEKDKKNLLEIKKNGLEGDIKTLELEIFLETKAQNNMISEKKALAAKYREIAASAKNITECPTCEQPISEKTAELICDKESKIIVEKGTALKSEINKKKAEIDKKLKNVKQHKVDLEVETKKLKNITNQIDLLNNKEIIDTPEIKELLNEVEKLNNKKEKPIDTSAQKTNIDSEKQAIFEMEVKARQIERNIEAKEKLDALLAEYKEKGKELIKIEQLLIQINLFNKIKAEQSEEKINELFKECQFRLFEKQLNGNYKEVCEVLINGVPYLSVNNAARLNTGIEIIERLAEHFKTNLPVFIDNAESITKIKVTNDNQQVRLIVDMGIQAYVLKKIANLDTSNIDIETLKSLLPNFIEDKTSSLCVEIKQDSKTENIF